MSQKTGNIFFGIFVIFACIALVSVEVWAFDRATLTALYDATNGANWTNNTNWKTNKPLGEWHGATTNYAGQVIALFLQDNGPSGPIPIAFWQLTIMEKLSLRAHELLGVILGLLGPLGSLGRYIVAFLVILIPTTLLISTDLVGDSLGKRRYSPPTRRRLSPAPQIFYLKQSLWWIGMTSLGLANCILFAIIWFHIQSFEITFLLLFMIGTTFFFVFKSGMDIDENYRVYYGNTLGFLKRHTYLLLGVGMASLALFCTVWLLLSGGDGSGGQVSPSTTDGQPELPPILTIEDITISKSPLDAEETATLSIRIKNDGPGDAHNLTIELSSDLQGLSFPHSTPVPTISRRGGQETVDIRISGELDLPTDTASLDIRLIDPIFDQEHDKPYHFETRKFPYPKLVLANVEFSEKESASPNGRIDLNEMFYLKFSVRNSGAGTADNVTIKVENNQTGVRFLGIVDIGSQYLQEQPTFSMIDAGKSESVTYAYFVNSEFTDRALRFKISATERHGEYGFNEQWGIQIGATIKQ